MQLIVSRTYPFLDTKTLVERQARDTLLRIGENEFILHMTSDGGAEEERLVWFDCRAALLWISQDTDEYGSDWEWLLGSWADQFINPSPNPRSIQDCYFEQQFSYSLRAIRMAETRIAPRHRVTKPAKIEYGGYKIPCTVRDLSITGAAIEVSDQREIPATFTLAIPDDGLKLPCRVVWRRDFRIGIAFD
jgi:PilZ domain